MTRLNTELPRSTGVIGPIGVFLLERMTSLFLGCGVNQLHATVTDLDGVSVKDLINTCSSMNSASSSLRKVRPMLVETRSC